MPIVPVTSATTRSKWPYGFNARMQCSCAVLTLIGWQNDLSQPQCPVTQIPTTEMTWIQTQIPRLKSCNLSHATLPIVHVLTKTSAHPWQSVQHIITAHGATMCLPALKSFLHKHMPRNNIVPSLHNCFDVYWQVVVVTPPDPCISDSPKQWHIRATPEVQPGPGQKPGSPARFDIALISDGVWMSNLQTFEGRQLLSFKA